MSNPRRRNGHARNKLRRQVLNEETHCGLCGHPVDTTLPHGMPDSPEVDEIIPVSLGGNPLDRRNTQLAHRLCNQRKGNTLNKRITRTVPTIPTRDWFTDEQ